MNCCDSIIDINKKTRSVKSQASECKACFVPLLGSLLDQTPHTPVPEREKRLNLWCGRGRAQQPSGEALQGARMGHHQPHFNQVFLGLPTGPEMVLSLSPRFSLFSI